LLEAAKNVPRVLTNPKPYVRITNFRDYAVEYTLYVFIKEIKKMREIDAELHEAVLKACKNNKIDISTALILRQTRN
jgi:small-conductance mechanosensitive channel